MNTIFTTPVSNNLTPQEIVVLAKKLYNECPTPKPTWEQLGEVTKSVWIERVEKSRGI